ncbi:MAG: hypothetical protein IPF95_14235 [Flavobacteriales bacterium]|nr:hypothetical protein [Flavobacteriales bacterium]MBK6945159.1 hypothetical protein [Flavobacteriales bacterium]HQV52271.1 hypothetical protein [Flavobacteriales bacterium]
MMRSIPVLLCTILFLGLGSCTTPSVEGNLCQRTFMPYPDLNPNRIGNRQNDLFIDGMIAYNDKDYAGAVEKLKPFVMKRNSDRSAQLYLACSYLALNKPYDAELALDHVENGNLGQYKDEAEWFTVVCWVCSDQLDRARSGAKKIADRKHTYQQQAADLLSELGS